MNDADNEVLRAMSGPPSRFKREGGRAPHHKRMGAVARKRRIESAQRRASA